LFGWWEGFVLRGWSSQVGEGEVEAEEGEEGFVVFGGLEDGVLVYATIVDVVVATWMILLDGVFGGHRAIISCCDERVLCDV